MRLTIKSVPIKKWEVRVATNCVQYVQVIIHVCVLAAGIGLGQYESIWYDSGVHDPHPTQTTYTDIFTKNQLIIRLFCFRDNLLLYCVKVL